jgi:hypothetical protein
VSQGHGVGDAVTDAPDKVIPYAGAKIAVKF